MMMRSIRKNLQFVLIIVVAAFAVTIYYGYGARQPMGPGQAEAAAVVNDTAITFNELNAAFSNMASQYDPAVMQEMDESTLLFFRRMVLENLINNELLYQEAQSRRIRVPDAEVNQQVDRFRESFPSSEDWNRFLRFQGISLRDVREAFRRQLMIEYLVNSLAEDIVIPDEEIENYYQDNQEIIERPFEEVEKQIREFLQQERQQNRLERLLAELRENSEVIISEALTPETAVSVENGIGDVLIEEDLVGIPEPDEVLEDETETVVPGHDTETEQEFQPDLDMELEENLELNLPIEE